MGARERMKLVVLGATGRTGVEIVRQAIERGHAVTVFVRSPDPLRAFNGRVSVQQGDLLNRDALEQVIRGHDAVVSAFGPRTPVSKTDQNLNFRGKRSRLDDGATTGTYRQALHRKVPRARGPPAPFWFQNLAGGCRRFHAQCCGGSRLEAQDRRDQQLTPSASLKKEERNSCLSLISLLLS